MIAQALLVVLGLVQAPSTMISGEIPLDVAAKGTSVVPADKATMVLNLRCDAATSAEAKKLVQDRADSLIRELVSIGVPRQSIAVDEPLVRVGFVGNSTIDSAMNNAQQGTPKPKRSSSLAVTLTFTDLSLLPRVQAFLDGKDAVTLESPLFELKDDRAARSAAIADAIQKARSDAEAYASSLGMRVSRLVSIKDQNTQASPFGDYGQMFEKFVLQKSVPRGKVETDIRIDLEFALAPR